MREVARQYGSWLGLFYLGATWLMGMIVASIGVQLGPTERFIAAYVIPAGCLLATVLFIFMTILSWTVYRK